MVRLRFDQPCSESCGLKPSRTAGSRGKSVQIGDQTWNVIKQQVFPGKKKKSDGYFLFLLTAFVLCFQRSRIYSILLCEASPAERVGVLSTIENVFGLLAFVLLLPLTFHTAVLDILESLVIIDSLLRSPTLHCGLLLYVISCWSRCF